MYRYCMHILHVLPQETGNSLSTSFFRLVAGEVHQLFGLGAPLHGQDAIVDDGLPELEQNGNPGLDVVHVCHIS